MARQPILHLLGVRHGKATYREELSGLTPEGEDQARAAAQGPVTDWLERNGIDLHNVAVLASPAARARGTAMIIRDTLKLPGELAIDHGFAPMRVHDLDRLVAELQQFSGKYIDYEGLPIFRDPSCVEVHEEIRARALRRLAELVCAATRGEMLPSAIVVSHYEILCHIALDLFGIVATEKTAFGTAETMSLTFFEGGGDLVRVEGLCRKLRRTATFHIRDLVFLPE